MYDPPAAVRGISLRELLPDATFVGTDDICIRSCSSDSRRCQPGDLFAALPGCDQDGHNFVGEARLRGATAVLACEPLLACNLPTCIVPDSREAFGRICQALAGEPGKRLKLIGITGTNGKTTSSYLAASVLVSGGFPTAVMGTLGSFDGVDKTPTAHTTPTAPVLATWLANSLANGCTHAVLEVSSHALCQSRVAGLEFDVACVTNVRHDHLDYHGNWNEYLAAKAKLLERLSLEGMAVVNRDDPGAASLLNAYDGLSLTVGLESPAEITATVVEQAISEQTFLLSAGNETAPVRTRLVGDHNIYNCLIAAAVGQSYGLDLATIARGLERITHIPGRLERVECGQGFGVFVDYAHTPDALAGVLATLRPVTSGRLICVFGAGGDRDRVKRPWMGRAVESGADLAVVTSDNPRGEDPQVIIGELLTGFRNRGMASVIVDRAEAIRFALAEAREGDCVLIAGKGHEKHQIIGDQWLEFDDYEMARQMLHEGLPQRQKLRTIAEYMIDITLPQLHSAIGGQWLGHAPVDTDSRLGPVVVDSRHVQPGNVFWALPGTIHNGADFVEEAFARGAMGVVSSRPFDPPPGCWGVVVNDALAALHNLARWQRGRFTGQVIAVTGSVGKTTTRQMIDAVLSTRLNGIASPHNYNNHVGLPLSMLALRPAPVGQASSLSFASDLTGQAGSLSYAHEYGVFELGASAPGEIAALAELCAPTIGVITAIGEAHLGHFGSQQAIAEAKTELLAALPADGHAVLNGDDAWLRRYAPRCRARIVWVGRGADCDLTATHIESRDGELQLQAGGLRLRVPVWGRHYLTPLLAAVAVGEICGVPRAEMAHALSDFQSPPWRCQVAEVGGVTVINDSYNSSPMAMRAALEVLRDVTAPGRRIVVCGDMRELGPESANWHRRLGDEVVTLCGADWLLACGSYAAEVVVGARRAGMPATRTLACESLDEAAAQLRRTAAPGDAVLVKGSRALGLERVIEQLDTGRRLRVAA